MSMEIYKGMQTDASDTQEHKTCKLGEVWIWYNPGTIKNKLHSDEQLRKNNV